MRPNKQLTPPEVLRHIRDMRNQIQVEVPISIILAMIDHESDFIPEALRFERGYPYLENPQAWAAKSGIGVRTEINQQQISWGLMQVMGGTARWLGYKGRFLSSLCEPREGIMWGVVMLKALQKRYVAQGLSIQAGERTLGFKSPGLFHPTDLPSVEAAWGEYEPWLLATIAAYNGGPGAVCSDGRERGRMIWSISSEQIRLYVGHVLHKRAQYRQYDE